MGCGFTGFRVQFCVVRGLWVQGSGLEFELCSGFSIDCIVGSVRLGQGVG